jgi:hypothetical protein
MRKLETIKASEYTPYSSGPRSLATSIAQIAERTVARLPPQKRWKIPPAVSSATARSPSREFEDIATPLFKAALNSAILYFKD